MLYLHILVVTNSVWKALHCSPGALVVSSWRNLLIKHKINILGVDLAVCWSVCVRLSSPWVDHIIVANESSPVHLKKEKAGQCALDWSARVQLWVVSKTLYHLCFTSSTSLVLSSCSSQFPLLFVIANVLFSLRFLWTLRSLGANKT